MHSGDAYCFASSRLLRMLPAPLASGAARSPVFGNHAVFQQAIAVRSNPFALRHASRFTNYRF